MSIPTTVWIVTITRREVYAGNSTLGPFATKDRAVREVKEYVEKRYQPESIRRLMVDYGGDLNEGAFFSEDETIDTFEREVIQ